ncbi:MAG TPA: DUF1003 domain-containing protein [Candidatus Eisenbacteria bacterium]
MKAAELALKTMRKPLEQLTERERRVIQAVVDRIHVSRPMHYELEEGLTLGDRLSDRIARFGGSWPFIIVFFAVLFSWMALNTFALVHPFDRYPYILLNLVLSCLAAVQAPVILMSQNRQADKDRQQASNDYEVNLKAEIEIMGLHEKLEILRAQEIARLLDLQERQMAILESLVKARGGTA